MFNMGIRGPHRCSTAVDVNLRYEVTMGGQRYYQNVRIPDYTSVLTASTDQEISPSDQFLERCVSSETNSGYQCDWLVLT